MMQYFISPRPKEKWYKKALTLFRRKYRGVKESFHQLSKTRIKFSLEKV